MPFLKRSSFQPSNHFPAALYSALERSKCNFYQRENSPIRGVISSFSLFGFAIYFSASVGVLLAWLKFTAILQKSISSMAMPYSGDEKQEIYVAEVQQENPSEMDLTADKTLEVSGDDNGVLVENQNNIAARRNNKEEGKKLTPPNVKVPAKKNFGLLERYRSPTDSIMSPATRVLLARNKKSMRPIELPAYIPPKVSENMLAAQNSI